MADLQSIRCPQCDFEIPLTDAVTQSLRRAIERETEGKAAEMRRQLAEREKRLAEEKEQIARARAGFSDEVEKRLAQERAKVLETAARKAEEKLGLRLKDLETALGERSATLKNAQETELALRKEKRALEERQRELEVRVARQLDEERGRIAGEARKRAEEEQRLRLSEKEKVIGDLKTQIEELKRRAEQGSQQLQGEVLELDLESQLVSAFPHDGIEPVAKGVRGADVVQRVRTHLGADCGILLWEAKRAKNWSRDWVAKLKADQREVRAEVAILVTQVMPPGVEGFGQHEGVWLCDGPSMLALAAALRQGLVGIAAARQAEAGKAGKMEQLYEYLAGTEFRQRVEAIVDAFVTMQSDLEAEKRAYHKHWARRRKHIEQAITHTAMLYGSVQGIVGQATLPEIRTLELAAGDDADDAEETEEGAQGEAN